METNRFIKNVSNRTGLNSKMSKRAIEAFLETLAERITKEQAKDLASQLPSKLKNYVLDYAERLNKYSPEEFVETLALREGVDTEKARKHAKNIWETLNEAITKGEIEDIQAELPKEFDEIFSKR